MKSNYILQPASKSHCPKCGSRLELLCLSGIKPILYKPWFYICWPCKFIAEVGKGEVKRDEI